MVVTDTGVLPANTEDGVNAVRLPPDPILNCDTLLLPIPELATKTYLPLGSTVTDAGANSVMTIGVAIGVSAPFPPIVYCETVLLTRFAT